MNPEGKGKRCQALWAMVVSASPPPVEFEPVPLWVGGIYFGTRVLDEQQMPTNTFTNAAATFSLTYTEGTNPGEWEVTGVDAEDQPLFSGTLSGLPSSVFLLAAAQGGTFQAIVVGANGEFQGIGGTQVEVAALEAAAMPLAVAVDGVVLEYLGTAEDAAAPGQQVAWYVRRGAASAMRLMKIAQGGSGVAAVTLTDYSTSTVTVGSGSYDPASYLFQTGTTASLPRPLYSADPDASHSRVLLARADTTLPDSFVVRGQSWWYAGTDGAGNALYRGFYDGQTMSLGAADSAGQRLVTLTDPLSNNGATTQGTLSGERKSVRLRDGTLVLSGNEHGDAVAVQHQDQYKLETIAADLDIVGNNLSFGILQGDASLAGALFQFADVSATATLYQTLSRPQAEWVWSRAAQSATLPPLPVMVLDASSRLTLYDRGSGAAGVVLDPTPDGVSTIRGVLRVRPGGDISMGEFTAGGEP